MYLRRIERLHADGAVALRDVLRAYGGAYLEFHGYAEQSIGRLFVGLVVGRLACTSREVMCRVSVNSDAAANDVVRGERSFVDWLPYRRFTVRRAEAFFRGGRPFAELSATDEKVLDQSAVIRNALAHQSSAAIRRFEETFVTGVPLPPVQCRPAGYLRGVHTVGTTRMTYRLSLVVDVFQRLCS